MNFLKTRILSDCNWFYSDGFRDEEWDLHKEQVIYNANYAKYTQNEDL